jgi:hypothetical protein
MAPGTARRRSVGAAVLMETRSTEMMTSWMSALISNHRYLDVTPGAQAALGRGRGSCRTPRVAPRQRWIFLGTRTPLAGDP